MVTPQAETLLPSGVGWCATTYNDLLHRTLHISPCQGARDLCFASPGETGPGGLDASKARLVPSRRLTQEAWPAALKLGLS